MPHPAGEGPPKTRLMRGDRVTLIEEVKEKTKDPIAFSLNFPELVDQLAVGAEVFIDDGKAAARVVAKNAGRAEIEVYAAREKGVRLSRARASISRPPTRPAAADLEGFPRPRLHRRARRPCRLLLRAAGRRHRAPAGSSRRPRAQARAACDRAQDRDAARRRTAALIRNRRRTIRQR